MSAAVLTLPTTQTVDAAWEHYATLMRQAVDDPTLLRNRSYMERVVDAENKWKELYSKWSRC